MPDWVKNQWKHTHGMYKRVGGCAIVGINNRGSQIAAVNCDEVTDIICGLDVPTHTVSCPITTDTVSKKYLRNFPKT